MLGQAPKERQLRVGDAQLGFVFPHCGRALFKPCLCDPLIELVVAQIGGNGHALQFGFRVLNDQSGFVQGDIQRHGWASLAFCQGIALHHFVGQHGDFVARHVNR